MLGILPDRLDALDKEIARGALWHLRWSLQVLIHAPELVDCAEVSQSLDVLLVPTIGVVLHVQRVRVVQSATRLIDKSWSVKNLSILSTYPSGTSLSSATLGSCVALAIAGSTSTMLTIDLLNLKD